MQTTDVADLEEVLDIVVLSHATVEIFKQTDRCLLPRFMVQAYSHNDAFRERKCVSSYRAAKRIFRRYLKVYSW